MRITAKLPPAALCLAALFVVFFVSAAAYAQGSLPVFDHIVVIVQENRTPDNLFGSSIGTSMGCGGQQDFEPGQGVREQREL
jgi:phospholipase C